MAEFIRKPKSQSYGSDRTKMAKGGQSIKQDKGNNAGPGTTEEVGEGKINVSGSGDYMGGKSAQMSK